MQTTPPNSQAEKAKINVPNCQGKGNQQIASLKAVTRAVLHAGKANTLEMNGKLELEPRGEKGNKWKFYNRKFSI